MVHLGIGFGLSVLWILSLAPLGIDNGRAHLGVAFSPSWLRISAHNLYIERGRYERPYIPREGRWCAYCFMTNSTTALEDEEHVLLHCPLYSNIRSKLLPPDQNITSLKISDRPRAECGARQHAAASGGVRTPTTPHAPPDYLLLAAYCLSLAFTTH